MGQHHEVRHEVLYVKEPGTERLRKGAAARLRYLLATGWRETERWHAQDHMTVKVERSGVAPRMTKMPKIEAAPPRPPRQGFGRSGGPGFGRGPGGPGAGRGSGAPAVGRGPAGAPQGGPGGPARA